MIKFCFHKTRTLCTALFVVYVFAVSYTSDSHAFGKSDNTYLVKKVIDGDTVELANGKRLRYIGIDTPETMKRKKGGWVSDPETFAAEAKKYNKGLVLGKTVSLEFDIDRKDKYGRLLAYVYTEDGAMVNMEIVKAGYATLYVFPPNTRYYDDFLTATKEARLEKRGLWENVEKIVPEEASTSIGDFCTVYGKIDNVKVRSDRTYLNFALFDKHDFTVIIYDRNRTLFSREGIDPSTDYDGKNIELTGRIIDRHGPRMVVDNPSQIRVTD